MLALFFAPEWLKRKSTKHHAYLAELQRERDQARSQGTAPPEVPWPEHQITLLRQAWLRSGLVVVSVVVAATCLGFTLGLVASSPSPSLNAALQFGGATALLWATLSAGGWRLRTWKGETIAEHINQWLFRSLYVLGTFLIVLSVVWSAVAA